ncbi:MAG: response regulator [Rhizobacter sp.]
MFVEDSEQLRETMAILLEDDGREVVTVASAEEARDLHRAAPFDLVVTDLTLGAMSGADLAREVLAADPDAWVVLASGYAVDPALRALGPNVRVFAKPFTSADIEAVVREASAPRGPQNE